MPPIQHTQPRLQQLVSAFGRHPDWQNVFRFALGELQNDPKRQTDKERLALWLLQAGNPFRVLDSLETDRLVLPPELESLTRWLVHLFWWHQENFTNKWVKGRPKLSDTLVKETEDATVADVVAALLKPENRDSRVLIAAWELAEAKRLPAVVSQAKQAFLSEFGQLLARKNPVAQSLVAANDPRLIALSRRKSTGEPEGGSPRTGDKRHVRGLTPSGSLKTSANYAQCPAGDFLMGSARPSGKLKDGDPTQPDDDEFPQHPVTLDSFQLQQTTVTNRQFALFDPGHAARFGDYAQSSALPQCPAIYVNWHMAKLFGQWLTGLESALRYSLPTEAQWEYACRAGTTTPWCCATEAELKQYAWYDANAERHTHPVGEKKANLFGLYDMHGNVWEWCHDWSGAYESASQTNPEGPNKGESRVLRGGGDWYYSGHCRSAYRYGRQPAGAHFNTGFRVFCLPASQD